MSEPSPDIQVLAECAVTAEFDAVGRDGAETHERREGSRLTASEVQFAQELFERHRFSLYGYLSRLLHSREEAKEILQESYLRVLRQPGFGRLRTNARAYARDNSALCAPREPPGRLPHAAASRLSRWRASSAMVG